MAANETVQIVVQVVEDNKKSIDSVVKNIQLALDKDFKLKVSDEGATKQLEEMLGVLKNIGQQMSTISKGLSNSGWGKLSEDLNIAISEFRSITQAAEKFGAAMSKSFASGLTAEINTLLPKLSEAATLVNKVKDESRKADGSGGLITAAKDIEDAKNKYSQILYFLIHIDKIKNSLSEKGFDVSGLQSYISKLAVIRDEFEKIHKSQNGLHPTSGLNASEYAKSVGLSSIYSQVKNDIKFLEEAKSKGDELLRLAETLKQKMDSLSESNPYKGDFQASIDALKSLQVLLARQPQDLFKNEPMHVQQIQVANKLLADSEQKEREIQAAAAASVKEEDRRAKSINDAKKELDALERKMAEYYQLVLRGKAVGVDTSSIEKAISKMEKLYNTYQLIAMGNGNFSAFKTNASTVTTERDIDDAVSKAAQKIKDQERKLKQNEVAKERAARAANRLSVEEQKLASAMRQTTQNGTLQTAMLNDLKSMATQYLSIWGASSFVKEMAQITGELELQQKSLEVIIGSASYASQLFGEIRDLSQQSPYTFQDLLKSTRQLAAFGIETKDIYGTMKALSDIGAGLSVDVQRLILAYGHTKSYGYLSGIQNRQFETAGIDLVGALADRYNKLADAEERAGRAAEHVTRKDVFKMISKKEVDFEDVNAVIMGLDAPGGRFYNMQERQFETLGGKLRNLRNNYNIMMAEMGKANHGMLMSGVNMLNELTGHWDKYAKVITAILVPLGLLKVATLAVNSAIGVQTDAMSKNVMALVRNQRATANAVYAMRESYFGAIGKGWSAGGSFKPKLKDSRSFFGTLSKGYESGQISKSQLMMMGTDKNLPEVYRRLALSIAGVDHATRKAIASSTGWARAQYRLKYSLSAAASAVRSFGAALGAMAMQMAPLAAIGAVVAVIQHFKSMAEETKQALDDLSEHARQDAESINEVIDRYSDRGVKQTGETSYVNGYNVTSTGLQFDRDKIKEMTISDVEDLKLELQKYSPLYDADLIDIGKLESTEEQIIALFKKLDSYRRARELASAMAGDYQEAASGSFWGGYESFSTNMEDMAKSVQHTSKAISSLNPEQIHNIDEELGGLLTNMKDAGVATSEAEALRQYIVRAMFMDDTDRQQLQKNWSDTLKMAYYDAANKEYSIMRDGSFREGEVYGAKETHNVYGRNSETQIKNFRENVDRLAESVGPDLNRYGDDFGGALTHAKEVFDALAANAKNVSDEVKAISFNEYLEKVFAQSNLQGAYKNYVNTEFKADAENAVNTNTSLSPLMSQEEIATAVSEQIEKVKEKWKAAGKKLNLITEETVNKIIKSYQNANMPKHDWQKIMVGQKGDNQSFWKGFTAFNSKDIMSNQEEADFWDAIRKKYKKLKESVLREKLYLEKTFKIKINPEVDFNSSEAVKKIMSAMNFDNRFYKDKKGQWQVSHAHTGANYNNVLDRELPRFKELAELYNDLAGAEERNVQLADDKKKKSGGSKEFTDWEYQMWEQRIRIIKEARKEYDYWEKAVGKSSAQDKVKAQFDELISKSEELKKALKPGDLNDLEGYKEVLESIRKDVNKRYEKDIATPESKRTKIDKTKIKNDEKLLRDLAQAMNEINKMEYEKATERFVSGMTKGLEDITRRWEIFNSVREKVGDDMAMRLSGLQGGSGSFKSDSMRSSIESMVANELPNIGKLNFNDLLGLDEKGLNDEVHKMFRVYTEDLYNLSKDETATKEQREDAMKQIDEYERRIKSLVEALKQWQKTEQDTSKDAIAAYSDVINSSMDYKSQEDRIISKYNKRRDYIKKGVEDKSISEEDANNALNMTNAEEQSELWKLTVEYANLMSRATALTADVVKEGLEKANSDLESLLRNKKITPTEYAEKKAQLKGIETARRSDNFFGASGGGATMLSSGWNGLVTMHRTREQNYNALYADNVQKYGEGSKEAKDAKEKADKEGKKADREERAAKAMDDLVKSMQDLSAVTQLLGNLFDSLGMEGASDAMGGASDLLGGMMGGASALSALGPYGMAAGAALGLVTAASEMHDKFREKQIQKISGQIDQIHNTLDTIRSFREQELGYAKGDNIRSLIAYYNNGGTDVNTRVNGKSVKNRANSAMAEYYERAVDGKSSSSYAMEYNMLLEERKKKMEQYNLEADKKKKDPAKLEEYKKAIAEMDAQIQAFAENLMSELWGMDFSSWASQISDALMTAFENGESSAKAFKDTMADIMRSVVKNMINMAVIEPFVDRLKDKLLGQNGLISKNKNDFINNPSAYTGQIISEIGKWYRSDGVAMVTTASEVYNGMEDLLKQYDISLANKESSGSNSISQSITEETAGYMTGILAAMHQDGSVRRLMLNTLVAEQMPNVIEMMTVSGGHIAGIDENTRAIMHMMQDGSGRMFERIDYIGTKLDRFASGFDRVTIA